VVVAFIVGTAIVYQVLATDVAKHLKEYATLKAIGYGNNYLAAIILAQAGMLAVLGFVPGALLSEGLYRITSFFSNVPVRMNSERLVFVFCLAVAMCAASGLVAIRKVRTADPADLF
jgi:putative ABC transport system permease protein